MNEMLEFSNKDFKAAIIKIFNNEVQILFKNWKSRKVEQKKKCYKKSVYRNQLYIYTLGMNNL